MKVKNLEEEIKELLDKWNRSVLDKDVAAAAQLREDGYSAVMPDGVVLTKEEELAAFASPDHSVESIRTQNLEVRGQGNEATAVCEQLVEGEYLGERFNALCRFTISFGKTDGVWRARSSSLVTEEMTRRQTTDGAPREPPKRG